jgi:hypothetical protein
VIPKVLWLVLGFASLVSGADFCGEIHQFSRDHLNIHGLSGEIVPIDCSHLIALNCFVDAAAPSRNRFLDFYPTWCKSRDYKQTVVSLS